ncbi:MAG TPA: isoprenylcysteine carboxylmethyltransferase family protein [Bryobacteraceae bacterium]|nr:isoprenylcysteine carboxylmethyltransferase family protein [Bryobacteraceae bacterium]
MTWTQSLLAALFLGSLGSFSWAMRKFFTRPSGTTSGMKVIAGCGVLFAILHLMALAFSSISYARGLTGAVLYSASLALFWWAILMHLGRPLSASFSPDRPVHLVQSGPYRFIRHPLYTSYLLTWAAAPIATGRWYLLGTVAAMAAIYVAAATAEEKKFLDTPLADAYLQYRSRTGLFFPNVVKAIPALLTKWAANNRLRSFRKPA